MTYQVLVYQLCFNFSLALITVINGPAKRVLLQRDARMLSCLIYFFALFSINYIPHNYVIPQAMPHAIKPEIMPSPYYPFMSLEKKKRLIAGYMPFHKLISPFTPTGGSWVAGRPKKTRRV